MFDNVNWDCYINPPDDWYGQEPEEYDEDPLLEWVDENLEWLEYLENANGEA